MATPGTRRKRRTSNPGVPLSPRDVATIHAALRYWQREGLLSDGIERLIASDNGTLEPMSAGDIDTLCANVNGADAILLVNNESQ
jgi:hypothetical protein